jgi:hypothetical protein
MTVGSAGPRSLALASTMQGAGHRAQAERPGGHLAGRHRYGHPAEVAGDGDGGGVEVAVRVGIGVGSRCRKARPVAGSALQAPGRIACYLTAVTLSMMTA